MTKDSQAAQESYRPVQLLINTGMVMPCKESKTGWRCATLEEVQAGVAWRPAWHWWRN